MTESIRHTNGPDTPVLLRPSEKKDRYELVAGARRLLATKAIGLKEIPAIVKDLTAQQAAESQAIENIQREDLDPIDEARGFKILTQPGKDGVAKYTVDELRQRLGKSLNYVYRSLALLELPKEGIEAIEDGKLTAAHGLQILRVPPFEQKDLIKQVLSIEGMTATDLRYRIDNHLGSDLSSALFPKNKPYAGMSPCTTCPSNTGNQGALFDGAEKGQCMNKPCFTTKTKQHKADFLDKLRLEHLDAKFVEYAKGYVYAGTMRTGGYVARAELDAKKPPKGIYGLMIASDFGIWVTVPDKVAAEVMAERAAEKPVDPKDVFVEAEIRGAMYAAAAVAAKKLKPERKDWVKMALLAMNDLPNRLWAAVLGVDPEESDDGDFEKASEDKLRAIVLLNQRLPYSPGDADFKKLGVDVTKVKKEAKAAADKAWAAQIELEKQAMLKRHNAPMADEKPAKAKK